MKALVTTGAAALLVISVFAQSESQLNDRLGDVQRQSDQVRQKLEEAKQKEKRVSQDMERMDRSLSTAARDLEDTRDRLESNRDLQSQLADELVEAGVQLEDSRVRIKSRLRSMYKSGGESPVLVLLGSKDVAAFASRKAILERIAKRDREMFDQAEALKADITQKKAEQDEVVKRITNLEAKQEREKVGLQSARNDKAGLLKRLEGDLDAYERQLDALARKSAQIEAELQTYLSTGGNPTIVPHQGKLMMPVVGRRSSPYGMRNHPIVRKRKMHTGMDIAAKSGTPIVAAAGGVVYKSGRQGGYGNTVIIDHGGGMMTLYAHCSRLYVKAGQIVEQGEKIAAVGSTGMSTGPHLHFEVRIGGKHTNPASYF
jgi:murein DD-endopeptidase MepM/ murein hydrolase activator NlpD